MENQRLRPLVPCPLAIAFHLLTVPHPHSLLLPLQYLLLPRQYLLLPTMPPAESQTCLNDLIDAIRSPKDVLELLRRRLPSGWTFFPPSNEDDGLRLSHSTFDEVSFQSRWNRTLVLKSLFKEVDTIKDPPRFSVREIVLRRGNDASNVLNNGSNSIVINPFDDNDVIVIVEREWSLEELLKNVEKNCF